MTIEQINAMAIKASAEGDMDALEAALKVRERAIRDLIAGPPSKQLLERVQDAITAGDSVKANLARLHVDVVA